MLNENFRISNIYNMFDKITYNSFKKSISLSEKRYIDIEELCLGIIEIDKSFLNEKYTWEQIYKLKQFLKNRISEKNINPSWEYIINSELVKNILYNSANEVLPNQEITNTIIWKNILDEKNIVSDFIKDLIFNKEIIIVTSEIEFQKILNNELKDHI